MTKTKIARRQALERERLMANWLHISHTLEDEGVDLGRLMEAWVADLGLTIEDALPGGRWTLSLSK